MAQVNAGRVRFVGRGEYDNSTQYYTFDLVNYNGNSYFAKSNTMGNLPTNSTYWQLVAEKGNKGDTGATGNGIASITKTSTSGLVDTYTITYTSGNTTTFNVTNGNGIDYILLTSRSGATKVYTIYFTDGNTTTFTVEDGEVTQEVFDEEVDRLKMVYNAMPKVSGEGTNLTLNNTAECPVYDVELSPSELEQATTTGKNLFDESQLLEATDWSLNSDGYYNGNLLNLQNKFGTNSNGFNIFGSFKENTQYTMSFNAYVTGGTGIIRIFYTDDTYNTLSISNTTAEDKTIVSLSDKTISRIIGSYSSQGSTNSLFIKNIQLEEGTTPTDFEKFTYGASPNPQYPQEIHTVSGENTITISNSDNTQSQTYPLSLGDLEYCKIGDYEDLFFKNVVGSEYYDSTLVEDKWYLKKNIGKVVLNGSESWSYGNNSGATSRRFITSINNIKQGTNNQYPCFSNRFLQQPNNKDNFIFITTANNYVWFGSTQIENLSIAEFKEWLSINNVIVYYVLATPTNILLSDTLQTQLDNIQKAITYQDQTNVSQTNADLPFVIKMSAIRDLSGIFELIQ